MFHLCLKTTTVSHANKNRNTKTDGQNQTISPVGTRKKDGQGTRKNTTLEKMLGNLAADNTIVT